MRPIARSAAMLLALMGQIWGAEAPGSGLPAKDALLEALRAWGVPSDTWVLLSPEAARRVVAEPPTGEALLDSPERLERLGCVVVQGAAGRMLISDHPRFHVWDDPPVPARSGTVARICDGVAAELKPWFALGAWIPLNRLNDDARAALSSAFGPRPGSVRLDSPSACVRISLALTADLRAEGSNDVLRQVTYRTGPDSHMPLVAIEAAPGCYVSSDTYSAVSDRASALPSEPLGRLWGELVASAAGLKHGPEEVPGLFTGGTSAEGLGQGAPTVWTLGEWAEHIRPLWQGQRVVVDRDDAGSVLVVPASCASWADTIPPLHTLARMTFRAIRDVCYVTGADTPARRQRERAASAVGTMFAGLLALRVLEVQWPAATGTPLSETDRSAMAEPGVYARITPEAASLLWAAPRGSGPRIILLDEQGNPVPEAPPRDEPVPAALEARFVPSVSVTVTEVVPLGDAPAAKAFAAKARATHPELADRPLFDTLRMRKMTIGGYFGG